MNMLTITHLAVFGASAAGIGYLAGKRDFLLHTCRGLGLAAIAGQLAWLIQAGLKLHYCPLLDPWGVMSTFTVIGIGAGLVSEPRYHSPRLLIAILVLISLATIGGLILFPAAGSSPMPVGRLLPLHIFLIMLGISGMALAFVAGLHIILRSRGLKAISAFDADQARWPSLTALDRLFVRGLGLGLLFLIAGIFLGLESRPAAALAAPWWLDPKVLFTSASLTLYAVVWGLRRSRGFCTPSVVGLSSVGFIMIFLGFLTSSLFTTSFHKF